jgi:hypothetical protein
MNGKKIVTNLCSFYDGSTRCRQDLGGTRRCKGDPAKCPRLQILMRRPREVKRELELLAGISGGGVNDQPMLSEKALAWVLGHGGVSRPSKWWKR